MADLSICRWRTGRSVGRTIYAQAGPEPSGDDVLIGTLDTPALAAEAVAAHNVARAARLSRPDGGMLPGGAYEAADEAFEGRGVLPAGARDELEAALLAAEPLIVAAERARIRRGVLARELILQHPVDGDRVAVLTLDLEQVIGAEDGSAGEADRG